MNPPWVAVPSAPCRLSCSIVPTSLEVPSQCAAWSGARTAVECSGISTQCAKPLRHDAAKSGDRMSHRKSRHGKLTEISRSSCVLVQDQCQPLDSRKNPWKAAHHSHPVLMRNRIVGIVVLKPIWPPSINRVIGVAHKRKIQSRPPFRPIFGSELRHHTSSAANECSVSDLWLQ